MLDGGIHFYSLFCQILKLFSANGTRLALPGDEVTGACAALSNKTWAGLSAGLFLLCFVFLGEMNKASRSRRGRQWRNAPKCCQVYFYGNRSPHCRPLQVHVRDFSVTASSCFSTFCKTASATLKNSVTSSCDKSCFHCSFARTSVFSFRIFFCTFLQGILHLFSLSLGKKWGDFGSTVG